MSDQEIVEDFSSSVKNLKKQCIDGGMSEDDFKRLYFQSLKSLETSRQVDTQRTNRQIITKYRLLLLVLIVIPCTIYFYKSFYYTILCNLQEYIYPGLKLLRRLAIPFISLFPSLTDLYHETCLIQNPYFTVVDMDCWPCSSVANIRHVYNPDPVKHQHSAPFIYETDQRVITKDALKEIYLTSKDIFDKESSKILMNNKFSLSPSDVFDTDLFNEKNYYVWKFNNMNVAKLLRQIIQRPKVVPKFGQSTERFMIMDTSQKLLHIPDTECNFSFLLALSGSREIHLVPAEECKHQCKSLKVDLQETYLLWYNWWYWRPVVQPSIGNRTFIAHVGSYC